MYAATGSAADQTGLGFIVKDQAVAFSTCPMAVVHAPAERVWDLLSEPANYALWWDARLQIRTIAPAGPAQPGQQVEAQTAALGRQWNVNITVEDIDHARRVIDLTTRLPFGITVHNHITCVPLDATTCRVSFG
jgi:ligand-binding SRPBCC domain-containing protein